MYDRGKIMTEEERKSIIDWVCSNFYDQLISNDVRKLEYTFSIYDKTTPIAIWRIKNRIIYNEKLYHYINEPIGGDVLLIHLERGFTIPHTDSNLGRFKHIRFNVGIMIPSVGAQTTYDEKHVDIKEGHYVMCRSGLDLHHVGKNTSSTPRIIISYGFLIPEEDIHEHTIKNNNPVIDNWIELDNSIYYNKKDRLMNNMPSALSLLNLQSQFCMYEKYGLTWWTYGKSSKETLRSYLEHGGKV